MRWYEALFVSVNCSAGRESFRADLNEVKSCQRRIGRAPRRLAVAAGSLCAIAAMGLAGGAARAQDITIEGTTDPSVAQTWNRASAPPFGTDGCPSPCTVGFASYIITPVSSGTFIMELIGSDPAPPTMGSNPPVPGVMTDPFMLLYKPSFSTGAPFANYLVHVDDFGGGNKNSYLSWPVTGGDNYTIVATSYGPTTPAAFQGSFKLLLSEAAAVKTTLTGDEWVNITVHTGTLLVTTGAAVNGIEVIGDDGDINVTVDGSIFAANTGVKLSSDSGNITTTVTATGLIDPLIGIEQTTVSGTLLHTNIGTTIGDNIGVKQTSTGTGAVGTVTVTNSGTITGTALQGVLQSSVDANLFVTNTGTINGGTVGVKSTTTGAGDISIINTNSITGSTWGIDAEVTGSGNITISGVGGIVTGIEADTSSGYILITDQSVIGVIDAVSATGNVGITATASGGILAGGAIVVVSPGGTISTPIADWATLGVDTANTGTGPIFVANNILIDTTGNPNVDAIKTAAEAGETFIQVAADLEASGSGVNATSTSGKIEVTTLNGADIDGPIAGIKAATEQGNVEITVNDGSSVTSALSAIDATSTDGGTIDVSILGADAFVSGDANAIVGSTSAEFNITNSGTIVGLVNVTAATSSFFDHTGYWDAAGGVSNYSGKLYNDGGALVSMHDNLTGDRIVLGRDYEGAGGGLYVDVDLLGATADRLEVAGDLTGVTIIDFAVLDHGFLANPLVVITQGSDVDGSEDFALFDPTDLADFGIITYAWGKQPDNSWAITSDLNGVTGASVLTNISSTVSAIAGSFYQPASELVVGKVKATSTRSATTSGHGPRPRALTSTRRASCRWAASASAPSRPRRS